MINETCAGYTLFIYSTCSCIESISLVKIAALYLYSALFVYVYLLRIYCLLSKKKAFSIKVLCIRIEYIFVVITID